MELILHRLANWRVLLAAVAGACLVPVGVLDAQDPAAAEGNRVTVTGRVVDAVSGTALPAVRIRLLPASPAPGADPPADPPAERQVFSDSEGRFVIEGVRIASYRVTAESLGYGALEGTVRVIGASPFDIRIQLAPEALALEGVVVTLARSPRLAAAGFYERQGRAFGSFVTRTDIEARFPFTTSDIFRTLPGVRVLTSGRGTVGIITLRGGCRPDIVMDGMNLGPNLSVDEIISPSDVEAIEVYRGASTPVPYSRSNCGVVVIWSADPATRVGDKPMSWTRFFMAAGFVVFAVLTTR